MRSSQLTDAHLGHTITWRDQKGTHTLTLGHVYVERSATGPTIVLIRGVNTDPWGGWGARRAPESGGRVVKPPCSEWCPFLACATCDYQGTPTSGADAELSDPEPRKEG